MYYLVVLGVGTNAFRTTFDAESDFDVPSCKNSLKSLLFFVLHPCPKRIPPPYGPGLRAMLALKSDPRDPKPSPNIWEIIAISSLCFGLRGLLHPIQLFTLNPILMVPGAKIALKGLF